MHRRPYVYFSKSVDPTFGELKIFEKLLFRLDSELLLPTEMCRGNRFRSPRDVTCSLDAVEK